MSAGLKIMRMININDSNRHGEYAGNVVTSLLILLQCHTNSNMRKVQISFVNGKLAAPADLIQYILEQNLVFEASVRDSQTYKLQAVACETVDETVKNASFNKFRITVDGMHDPEIIKRYIGIALGKMECELTFCERIYEAQSGVMTDSIRGGFAPTEHVDPELVHKHATINRFQARSNANIKNHDVQSLIRWIHVPRAVPWRLTNRRTW